ncbi:MAG: circumsporozoite protein [Pseudomonadota bacterium]|nr:circumsporozoite protein [Pseudomonadota bacterium]
MSIMQFGRAFVPLLLIATAACSGGEAEMAGNAGANAGADAPADPAELAEDAALANEAAADEAADIEAFGGNAAAMEGNRR